MSLDTFLAAIAHEPARAGLFTDFDGTLAPIQADPASVVPVDGVAARLDALAAVLGRVAVVSGRPVDFLRGFFDDEVELSGLYGIEHWTHDRLLVDRTAVEWLPRGIQEQGRPIS